MLERVSLETAKRFIRDYKTGGSVNQLGVEFLQRFYPNVADTALAVASDDEAETIILNTYALAA